MADCNHHGAEAPGPAPDKTARADPRGRQYFWLTGRNVTGIALPGSDVAAISVGRISVTPLHIDNTHLPTIDLLKKWHL